MCLGRVVMLLVGALFLSSELAPTVAAQADEHQLRLADRVLVVGPSVRLQAPENEFALKALLEMVAHTARVPMGVELLPTEPLAARVIRRPASQMMAVDQLSVASILEGVRKVNPKYGWNEAEGVIQIGPTDLLSNAADPLNRRAPPLVLPNTTATAALAAVRRIYDPNYVMPTREVHIGPQYSPEAQAQAARQFALNFPGGTVRQLLNAIVKAHGDLWWSVEYKGWQAAPETMVLSVRSFDGWGFTSTAPAATAGK